MGTLKILEYHSIHTRQTSGSTIESGTWTSLEAKSDDCLKGGMGVEATRSRVKVKVVAAFAAVSLLGLGAYNIGPGNDGSSGDRGATLFTHKPGHPKPPGCQKGHKYGKKPKKQKCPKHP